MEHWDRLRGDQGFYWDDGLFRPSTDTFLLGGFPVLRRGERACDLGAGTGLLGALLLTREPSLTVTGLELREDACRLARRTAERSGWQERLLCRQGDLRRREDLPPAGGGPGPAGGLLGQGQVRPGLEAPVCRPEHHRGHGLGLAQEPPQWV